MRLKYALRSLAASPSFTLGSILCLSIGLALTIAAFSVINAVLFRSMPGIQDQRSLRHIWIGAVGARGPEIVPPTPQEYETFRASLADVADVMGAVQTPVAAAASGAAAVVTRAVFVTPNYFSVLGTVTILGRPLAPDDVDGAIVSQQFWRAQFGARPDVLDEVLLVNGRPFRVTGVVPAKFIGATPGEFDLDPETLPSIWLPLAAHSQVIGSNPGRAPYIRMTTRLAPGVSEHTVAARAQAIAASALDTGGRREPFVRVKEIHRGPYDDGNEVALAVSAVMVVPLGILAIGCANVANLLLARGAARSREIAVRLALGATRARIVGELLTESLLLASAAAAAAVTLCALAMRLVEHWMPLPLAVDWRVVGFAGAAALITALLFGLLPAVNLAASRLTLRIHDARPIRPRTRRLLAGVQLAVSTALLVIAALFVRTLAGLDAQVHKDDEHVLTASFAVHLAQYDRARIEQLERDILDRVRAIEGVRAAGMGPNRQREPIVVRLPAESQPTYAGGGAITEGWLGAAGWTLTAGRDFAAHERRGGPTAVIVNDTMARRIAPAGTALGTSIVVSRPEQATAPRYEVQIVGIVANDARGPGSSGRAAARVFLPSAISDVDERTLWVRTEQPASAIVPTIRAMAAEAAPNVPVTNLETVAETRQLRATPHRWLARGTSAAGGLALLLAAFGLFSLLTYLVAQRQREIGIRLALGASRPDVVRLVVGESAAVSLAGAVVGTIAALFGANAMRSMFVGVGPTDPASYLGAGAVLMAAALAASAQPAFRASRTDPSEVLRAE